MSLRILFYFKNEAEITNTLTTNRLTMYGLTINLSLIHINDNMGTLLKGSLSNT